MVKAVAYLSVLEINAKWQFYCPLKLLLIQNGMTKKEIRFLFVDPKGKIKVNNLLIANDYD